MVQCIYLWFTGYNFAKIVQIDCVLANSVDPDEMRDEMPHYHLGLHCLQKYPFSGFPVFKGLGSKLLLLIF